MAEVIDISKCAPERTDKYFVDTNVWYWFAMSGQEALEARSYQLRMYPEFVEKILDEGARVYHSPFTLIEVAHLIEKAQCKSIYGDDWHCNIKSFRSDAGRREIFLNQVSNCWTNISSVSQCLSIGMDAEFASDFQGCLAAGPLDPYDSCYFSVMRRHGITQIVSDDADFLMVDSLMLFTANKKVIEASA